jgi:hypothetical protein
MAISACNLLSSSSSSSSATAGALPLTRSGVSTPLVRLLGYPTRDQLTLAVGHRRQDGDSARLAHLVVEFLLLEFLQLGLEVHVVDFRADVDAADCVRDLHVEPVVLLELVPATPSVPVRSHMTSCD